MPAELSVSMPGHQRLDNLRALPLPWDDEAFVAGLGTLLTFSRYAEDVARRYPERVRDWWHEGAPRGGQRPVTLGEAQSEAALQQALRQHRHQELFAILWHDVIGAVDTRGTLLDLSALASMQIQAALDSARRLLANFGTPRGAAGQPVDLVVFGLGKLGGRELNFSSDIDLVYAYAEAGETDGPRKLSNEAYFLRLGGLLARLLSQMTADGFCYRVDLRLRPFGEAGRLALTANAMEQYFQREGRDWERYAWIKARPVAGDLETGTSILSMLRPFIYRRYLDYGAYDALREMKALIRAEVRRKGMVNNVKLGRGGIRELEFFVQAFQLIRGGRERSLRRRSLLATLEALVALGEVPRDEADRLEAAYLLFRRIENRFQQVDDQQTHVPPRDEATRQAIAGSLGHANWQSLLASWDEERAFVRACFDDVFEVEDLGATPDLDRWHRLWLAAEPEAPAGWNEPLETFRHSGAVRGLGQRSRSRLDRFMPRLLAALGRLPEERSAQALGRVLQVISAIARRSSYLALLAEQDEVLSHLVALCDRSAWLTERLCRHPLVLDELIDRRGPDQQRSALAHLRRRLESATGDPELEMEILREVRDGRMLNAAIAWLDGQLDARAVTASLTELADAVLKTVYRIAWRDLAQRHGEPAGEEPGLALIGYGTLGGGELTFGSDLDLVFLYAGGDPAAMTAGPRQIANTQFYTRLSQRLLHLLTTQTASGRLYEVDTRLRPNGRAGLLVSSLEAFEAYQRTEAWVWEQQSLTRARWVAGAAHLRVPFERVRREIITAPRDAEHLRGEVVAMRERMRAELDRSTAERFDLKQGPGGRVDLEFLVQYARLRWGADHPALVTPTGTVATLEQLGKLDLLSRDQVEPLTAAHDAFQGAALRATLEGRPPILPAAALPAERAAVTALWKAWLGT